VAAHEPGDAFVEADYTTRASARQVLDALRQLA